jgi:hypothetical protein
MYLRRPSGHNSEEAIPPIIDAFWPVLETEIRRKLAKELITAMPLNARPVAN